MSAPMSERQQMKLLQKQQQEEQEQTAADAAATDTNRSSKRAATKASKTQAVESQAKKKSTSLAERKRMGRHQAAAKKQEESASEEISQEEDFGDDDDSSVSELDFVEDTSKKTATKVRQMRTSRKRRLSEDINQDDSASTSQNEQEDEAPDSKTERKKRLKKKTGRNLTRQSSSSLFDSDSDGDEDKNSDDASDKSGSADKTTAVPKKGAIPKKKGGIPKKSDVPRRKQSGDGMSGDAKAVPSLLQNMAPGNVTRQIGSTSTLTSSSLLSMPIQQQPQAAVVYKSPGRTISSDASRARNANLPAQQSQPIQRGPTPQLTPTAQRGMTPPPQSMGGNYIPPPIQSISSTQHQSPEEEKENRVLEAIGNMCDSLNKDGRFQIRSGPAIDMSGSFLSNERYDFFDVDSNGDIMLQAKIPIFPEDFLPGKPEWPLSWWGIVDPALAPTPTIVEEVQVKSDSKEATIAVAEWQKQSSDPSQQKQWQKQTQQKYTQPPAPTTNPGLPAPPTAGLPPRTSYPSRQPPQFASRPHDTGGRGAFCPGRGGAWHGRGGGRGRGMGQPPPIHGVPPPNNFQGSVRPPSMHNIPPPQQFPRGRGRGMRPGDRQPPPRPGSNNWPSQPSRRY